MATSDLTEQLHEVVDSIQFYHDRDVLDEYWTLAKRVLSGRPVHGFYILEADDYCNVAVIAGNIVVDVEGNQKSHHGSVVVRSHKAFSGIDFHFGPVATVPDSEGAKLVIMADSAGSSEIECYWIAYDEEQAEHLKNFGEALVDFLATGGA